MNKKITDILEDIINSIGLLGLICAIAILTDGVLSFIILIIALVLFAIKLMMSSKKLHNLNFDITEEKVENFESDLLIYSNDISKIKVATVKEENVEEVKENDINSSTEEITEPIEKEVEEDMSDIEDSIEEPMDAVEDVYDEDVSNPTETELVNDGSKEDKIDLTEEEIKKCIRKLGKGRKASNKAKELAKQYGYELKEGETFVLPRNK